MHSFIINSWVSQLSLLGLCCYFESENSYYLLTLTEEYYFYNTSNEGRWWIITLQHNHLGHRPKIYHIVWVNTKWKDHVWKLVDIAIGERWFKTEGIIEKISLCTGPTQFISFIYSIIRTHELFLMDRIYHSEQISE